MFQLIKRFLNWSFRPNCDFCGHYLELVHDIDHPYPFSNYREDFIYFSCNEERNDSFEYNTYEACFRLEFLNLF